MKKMISIILILLVIFIGMAVYKYKIITNSQIKIDDVNRIEEYIAKIYCWKEITQEALPKFDNINDAPEKWIWEVVKNNSEEYELTYEQINNKAEEIFEKQFSKKYPQEGTDSFQYNEETGMYIATEIQTDKKDDSFFVKKITKTQNGYEVEILEYLQDYTAYEQNKVLLKNLNEEIIATLDIEEVETKTIDTLKNNINKFSTKKITLKYSNENLYVEKIEG